MPESKFFCRLVAALAALSVSLGAFAADHIINVPAPTPGADMTAAIRRAFDEAKAVKSGKVTVAFQPGVVYNISRSAATALVRYVSNTTTRSENPDPTKHFGLWLDGMKNVTVDGRGATLLTHGEMTAIGIDNCTNITITNLTIDAADPSVPEMTVVARTDSTLTARVVPPSRYSITPEGKLYWEGEGWKFTGGIAQLWGDGYTLRCESPMDRYKYVTTDSRGYLVWHYDAGKAPKCNPGNVYQMRHSIRNEVATFINRSSNVTLSNMNYRFLGNFGIVAQMSSDLTYDGVNCLTDPGSGRTCAGFADFMQVSGCRGKVKITRCEFAGAHDDPINIHGTHLKVVKCEGNTVDVRFMHGQTRGFENYLPGDEIAVTDPHSLLRGARAKVKAVSQISDTDYRLTLDRSIAEAVSLLGGDAVIDNISANPEVEITDNTFTLTPTRGILLTTSRKAVIARNTFIKIPMASILIADDARSWYESGPVCDVTIRNNRFIDCSSPVILIAPENDKNLGPVHSGIRIISNEFTFTAPSDKKPVLVQARGVNGLKIKGNTSNVEYLLDIKSCPRLEIQRDSDKNR